MKIYLSIGHQTNTMGCFDYECECGGKKCDHVGGQTNKSNVIIEVPLSDGTAVCVRGEYSEYGYVEVGKYKFYPEQFRTYFKDWFDGASEKELKNSFLSNRIWTDSETTYTYDKFGSEIRGFVERYCFQMPGDLSEVTQTIASKCIRVDKGLNIRSKKQADEDRLKKLKASLESIQREINAIEKNL